MLLSYMKRNEICSKFFSAITPVKVSQLPVLFCLLDPHNLDTFLFCKIDLTLASLAPPVPFLWNCLSSEHGVHMRFNWAVLNPWQQYSPVLLLSRHWGLRKETFNQAAIGSISPVHWRPSCSSRFRGSKEQVQVQTRPQPHQHRTKSCLCQLWCDVWDNSTHFLFGFNCFALVRRESHYHWFIFSDI